MDVDGALVNELLDHFVWQKESLIEASGGTGRLNHERIRTMMRPRIKKMAEVVNGWDVRPDIIMTAVFAWAKKNGHPNGPMPNMLHSVKYVTSALSHYMQVPYEVVMERRCASALLERLDFEFERCRNELERAGVTELTSASSYPVEFRYLMSILKMDVTSAFFMAQELLEVMSSDRRVKLWMAHRGVRHEVVAAQFNKRKNKLR